MGARAPAAGGVFEGAPETTMSLTPKQRKWLEEYLICWNATEAARRAGYKNDRVSGHNNITDYNIQAEIQRRLSEKGMDADEVIARLADQATGDISDFLEVHPVTGFVKFDLEKAQERGKLHLIKKMKFKDGFLESVELHDSQSALVHLGKVHGIFIDRVKVEGWKQELEEQGLDPGEQFEQLVQSIAARIATVTQSDDGGSDGGSPSTG